MNTTTQNDAILAWLQDGWTLTPAEAYERFGCLRLGGRIHELRQMGYPIRTDMVKVGGNKRVARYSLEREAAR